MRSVCLESLLNILHQDKMHLSTLTAPQLCESILKRGKALSLAPKDNYLY